MTTSASDTNQRIIQSNTLKAATVNGVTLIKGQAHSFEAVRTVKNGSPVMPCHPAEGGGVSGQLARGSTPSTPNGTIRRKYQEARRMSIKKFFRCTPEENIIITTNAADAGMEQASYMRIQCIGKSKIRKARRIRADWDELRRLMGAINKIGNLINQLVKHLHRGGVPTNYADAALIELQKAGRAIVAALTKSQ